jgi:hypothetical protein
VSEGRLETGQWKIDRGKMKECKTLEMESTVSITRTESESPFGFASTLIGMSLHSSVQSRREF